MIATPKHNVKSILKNTKNLNVLFVEDDKSFNHETSEILEDYFALVDSCYNGEEGIAKYKSFYAQTKKYYDIVITDLNMPKIDGITLTKLLYEINPNQQIVIVSAYNESEFLIELINIGVNKFLLKPFNHSQLLELLNQLIRKEDFPYKNIIKLGDDFSYNLDNKNLYFKEMELVKLTKKENKLLYVLVANQLKVTTLEEIYTKVWDEPEDIPTTDSLKSLMSRLRKKIKPVQIETFYNIGYRISL